MGALVMSMPKVFKYCSIPQDTRYNASCCAFWVMCLGGGGGIINKPGVRGSAPAPDVARATSFCCFSVAPLLLFSRRAFGSMRYRLSPPNAAKKSRASGCNASVARAEFSVEK